jgi:hypothetical protein
MKKIARAFFLLTSLSLVFVSCKDSDKDPAPSFVSVGLVKTTVDAPFDIASGAYQYNLDRVQRSDDRLPGVIQDSIDGQPLSPTRPVINMTVDLYSQRDAQITKVYVYKTRRSGANPTTYTYGPRVLFKEVTTFPTTLTFNSQEALADLQRIGTGLINDTTRTTLINILGATAATNNQVFVGDAVVFTYEYEANTPSGPQRIVLTPTRQVTVYTPSKRQADVVTGSQINSPYATVLSFNSLVP